MLFNAELVWVFWQLRQKEAWHEHVHSQACLSFHNQLQKMSLAPPSSSSCHHHQMRTCLTPVLRIPARLPHPLLTPVFTVYHANGMFLVAWEIKIKTTPLQWDNWHIGNCMISMVINITSTLLRIRTYSRSPHLLPHLIYSTTQKGKHCSHYMKEEVEIQSCWANFLQSHS